VWPNISCVCISRYRRTVFTHASKLQPHIMLMNIFLSADDGLNPIRRGRKSDSWILMASSKLGYSSTSISAAHERRIHLIQSSFPWKGFDWLPWITGGVDRYIRRSSYKLVAGVFLIEKGNRWIEWDFNFSLEASLSALQCEGVYVRCLCHYLCLADALFF